MAAAWAAMQAAERREWVLALSQAKEEKRAAQAALRLGGRVQRQGEEWGQPPSGGRPREVQAPVALPARASENRRARRRQQLARPDEAAPAARLTEVGELPARPPAREGPDIQGGQAPTPGLRRSEEEWEAYPGRPGSSKRESRPARPSPSNKKLRSLVEPNTKKVSEKIGQKQISSPPPRGV